MIYKAGDTVEFRTVHCVCRCSAGVRNILAIPEWRRRNRHRARVQQNQYVGPDGRPGGVKIKFVRGDDWCWAPPGHVLFIKRRSVI